MLISTLNKPGGKKLTTNYKSFLTTLHKLENWAKVQPYISVSGYYNGSWNRMWNGYHGFLNGTVQLLTVLLTMGLKFIQPILYTYINGKRIFYTSTGAKPEVPDAMLSSKCNLSTLMKDWTFLCVFLKNFTTVLCDISLTRIKVLI